MQISPLNNYNFRGTSCSLSDVLPQDGSFDELGSKIEKLDKVTEKITNNVHPATIFSTLVVAYAAATKGRKLIPYARNAVVTISESVSKAAVGAFGKVANLFKKAPDTIKAKEAIDKAASKLRDSDVVNEKMLGEIKNFASKIAGDEKAQKITDFLRSQKITNGVRLTDAIVAMGVALGLVDGASDVVETALDKNDYEEAIKTIFSEVV